MAFQCFFRNKSRLKFKSGIRGLYHGKGEDGYYSNISAKSTKTHLEFITLPYALFLNGVFFAGNPLAGANP